MFKNITPYKLSEGAEGMGGDQLTPINFGLLEDAAAEREFVPCTQDQAYQIGFSLPTKREDAGYLHAALGWAMVVITIETRTVPSSAIAEEVGKRIKEINDKEQRTVYRKERADIKHDAEIALLPRAFARRTRVPVLFSPTGLVLVVTGSRTTAEACLNYLRTALGALRVEPLAISFEAADVMTTWLPPEADPNIFAGDDPDEGTTPGLLLGNDLLLINTAEGDEAIRIRSGSDCSESEVVTDAIGAGFKCRQLRAAIRSSNDACCWFTLGADLTLKSVKYDDAANVKDGAADEMDAFDSTFVIATHWLGHVYGELLGWMKAGKAAEA